GLREPDGGRREVDSDHPQTQARGHDRVLAGAAADVEDATDERAGIGQRLEGWLRPTDVPGWGEALIHRVEAGHRRGSSSFIRDDSDAGRSGRPRRRVAK